MNKPVKHILSVGYYLGRKNKRIKPTLYKKFTIQFPECEHCTEWFKVCISKDVFEGWNYCGVMVPLDMKEITEEEATEYLFEFCL